MEKLSSTLRLIEFESGACRIALPLDCVRRAVPSAELTPYRQATPLCGSWLADLVSNSAVNRWVRGACSVREFRLTDHAL